MEGDGMVKNLGGKDKGQKNVMGLGVKKALLDP